MLKMGFEAKWVGWIKMCIEFEDFNVLVDGDRVDTILLKRGLKQGGSSSTYIFILFILCMKGLSSLLKKAEGIGHIHGIKVCRGAHVLTHLLLADDIFFSGLLIMKLRSFNIS